MPQPAETFRTIKHLLWECGLAIVEEDPEARLFLVDKEEDGIAHMFVVCMDEVLVLEQILLPTIPGDAALCVRLLQWNRELVQGAFCLAAVSNALVYRDTLLLASLDRTALERSLRSLTLALAEFGPELLTFAGDAV